MRIVFLGSPDFALPSLRKLIESQHEIVAVYTQPDRPTGRGRKVAPPPIKVLALEHGLPVRQPASISKPEIVEELRQLAPDVGVIAAYGQILRQPVLDVPRLGVLNVHASLLPRWRGASPVPAAILAGDERTGATIMKVRLELDAGPILARTALSILAEDTAGRLTKRIADAGATLLVDVLRAYAAGDAPLEEQDESKVTHAPAIKKTDALIDWEREDALAVWRKVRAYNPWPMAYSYLDAQPLRIVECVPLAHEPRSDKPGTIFVFTGVGEPPALATGFGVVTAHGDLGIVRVQGPGGKEMHAADFLRGHREINGKRLTTEQ
ncbi:MAG: methionyl-tRNA formyltransferase [Chloroflexota bacterium]|nr:methionyl-tRNA formyltransferase [Chloroflexota bacterium]